MAGERPNRTIFLSRRSRAQLQSIAEYRSLPRGIVRQVKIILEAADRLNNIAIAKPMSLSSYTAGILRKRFLKHGTNSLFASLDITSGKVLTQCKIKRFVENYNKNPQNLSSGLPQPILYWLKLTDFTKALLGQ